MFLISKKNLFSNKKGFMMVEIVIVASIIAVAFIAIIAVAQKSLQVGRQSIHVSQANFLLEEGAEAVRIARDNAWTNISNLTLGTNYYPTFSGGTWTLSTTPSTVGIFTRKVVLSAVNRNAGTGNIDPAGTLDTGTKLVTLTVSWQEGGITKTKTILFYINDLFS